MTKILVKVPLSAVLMVLALAVSGCSSTQPSGARESNEKKRSEVERRLQEVFAAAEGKDFERLDSYHLYGPEFTKFTSSSFARLDSEGAKRGEHESIAAVSGLKMKAESLKVNVFGETAITTFILDLTFNSGGNAAHKKEQATIVFVKHKGSWKIAHEHFSAIAPP